MAGLKVIKELDEFVQLLADLIRSYLRYYKVAAYEQLVNLLSLILARTIIAVCALVASLFFSIAVAMYLGRLLGQSELGFLIIGVVYLLLGWLIVAKRNDWIINPILQEMSEAIDELEHKIEEGHDEAQS